jgi:hypothetical protein
MSTGFARNLWGNKGIGVGRKRRKVPGIELHAMFRWIGDMTAKSPKGMSSITLIFVTSPALHSVRNFFSSKGHACFQGWFKENKGMIIMFIYGKGCPFRA